MVGIGDNLCGLSRILLFVVYPKPYALYLTTILYTVIYPGPDLIYTNRSKKLQCLTHARYSDIPSRPSRQGRPQSKIPK